MSIHIRINPFHVRIMMHIIWKHLKRRLNDHIKYSCRLLIKREKTRKPKSYVVSTKLSNPSTNTYKDFTISNKVDTKYKSKPNLKISNLINTQISHQPQLTMTSMILRKAYKSGMFMDNDFNKNWTSNFPHSSHN
jgi:hypothetical protein